MPSSITNIDLNHKDRPRYSIVGASTYCTVSPLQLPPPPISSSSSSLSFPTYVFASLSLSLSFSAPFPPLPSTSPSTMKTYQSTYSARFTRGVSARRESRATSVELLIIGSRDRRCFPTKPFEYPLSNNTGRLFGRGPIIRDAIIFAKFAETRRSRRLSSRKMRLSTTAWWRPAFALPGQRNENFVVPSTSLV